MPSPGLRLFLSGKLHLHFIYSRLNSCFFLFISAVFIVTVSRCTQPALFKKDHVTDMWLVSVFLRCVRWRGNREWWVSSPSTRDQVSVISFFLKDEVFFILKEANTTSITSIDFFVTWSTIFGAKLLNSLCHSAMNLTTSPILTLR